MTLPVWHKRTVVIWAIAAPAFWLFASGFNGVPFFSLLKVAGPSEGEGWQISLLMQLAIYAALLAPLTSLPFAFTAKRRDAPMDFNSDA